MIPTKLNLVVDKFIEIQEQLRIFHWQTKSYSKHQAFGMAYEALGSLIDDFIEIHTAKYGRVITSGSIRLQNASRGVLDAYLKDTVEFLVNLTSVYNSKTDSDLLNLRDEILAKINHLKFQLTLR